MIQSQRALNSVGFPNILGGGFTSSEFRVKKLEQH